MPLKKKHTGLYFASSFNYRRDVKNLFIILFFLFTLSTGFASDQIADNVYVTENATIVYAQSDTNNVIITEGKITAVEGKSVRLLPGTHIKSSEQLTVNIASKQCQDSVAVEVAKKEEEKMLVSSAKKCEEVLPEENNAPTTFPFRFCNSHTGNSAINQQRINLVAFLTNTSVSFNAHEVYLLMSNDKSIVINQSKINNHLRYLPILSWGNSAESIKVMRC
jgi:hypothetical protein